MRKFVRQVTLKRANTLEDLEGIREKFHPQNFKQSIKIYDNGINPSINNLNIEIADCEDILNIKKDFQKQLEVNKEIIQVLQNECLKESKRNHSLKMHEIDSDDCMENQKVFEFMNFQQRQRHCRVLWGKAFAKARAGAVVIKFTKDLQKKIQLLGRTNNIIDKNDVVVHYWFIMNPNRAFSMIWQFVVAVLLIYTATYMPYKACFLDESTKLEDIIEWSIDILFMLDIVVNFITAVELSDGSLEIKPKEIAKRYLKSWFIFDFIAVLPFQLIEQVVDYDQASEEDQVSYKKLIRLARLPRLYRLTRLLRFFKILKALKNFKFFRDRIKQMKLSAAMSRMIQIAIFALIITHIVACLWFLTAKFSDFDEDTWVYRENLVNEKPIVLYAWSMHWATQTVATVGYGDIPAWTTTEIIFSFGWMSIGVAFYSFIIGNFTSIIVSNSQIKQSMQQKIAALAELAKKANIPFETGKRIKQFFENNSNTLFCQDDDQKLVKMLPPYLRDEILANIYGEMITQIKFFQGKEEDADFLLKIFQMLKDMQLSKQDVLYWRGDFANRLYWIVSGKIKLYIDKVPFAKYSDGDMFGDSDVLLNLPRDSKAVASTHVHLKFITSEQFLELSKSSSVVCLKMIIDARKRRDLHSSLINKLQIKRQKSVAIQGIQKVGSSDQNTDYPMSSKLRKRNPQITINSNKELSFPQLEKNKSEENKRNQPNNSPLASNQQRRIQTQKVDSKEEEETVQNIDQQNSKQSSSKTTSSNQINQSEEQKVNKQSTFQLKKMETIKENEFGSEATNSIKEEPNPDQQKKLFRTEKKPTQKIPLLIEDSNNKQEKPNKTKNRNSSEIEAKTDQQNQKLLRGNSKTLLFKSNSHDLESYIAKNINNNKLLNSPKMRKKRSTKTIMMSKKANMLDERLQHLAYLNRNVSEQPGFQQKQFTYKRNLLDKFWSNNVPVALETLQNDQAKHQQQQKSMGSQQSYLQKKQNLDLKLSFDWIKSTQTLMQQPVQSPMFPQNSPKTSSSDNDSKKSQQFKKPYMHSARKSEVEEDKLVVPKDSPTKKRNSFIHKQTLPLLKRPPSKIEKQDNESSPGLLRTHSIKHSLKRMSSNLKENQSELEKANPFINDVMVASNRYKDVQKGIRLQEIESRIKGVLSDAQGSSAKEQETPSLGPPSLRLLSGGIQSIFKSNLMQNPITEFDVESNESEWHIPTLVRRTLLDKVVHQTFKKDKNKLYTKFPQLARLTVPKVPIITPQGDEIIHKNKFREKLQILKEYWEEKQKIEEEIHQKKINKHIKALTIPTIIENEEDENSSQNSNKLQKTQNSDAQAKSQKRRTSILRNKPKTKKSSNNVVQRDKSVAATSRLSEFDTSTFRSMISKSPDCLISAKKATFLTQDGHHKERRVLRADFCSQEIITKLKNFNKKKKQSNSKLQKQSAADDKHSQITKEFSSIDFGSSAGDWSDLLTSREEDSIMPIQNVENEELENQLLAQNKRKTRETLYKSVHEFIDINTSRLNDSKDENQEAVDQDLLKAKQKMSFYDLVKEQLDENNNFSGRGETDPKLPQLSKNRKTYAGEDQPLKSMARFNTDNYLLSLNTFENLSTIDQVQATCKGLRHKACQMQLTTQSLQKKQARLDCTVDKMILKFKELRALKKELHAMKNSKIEQPKICESADFNDQDSDKKLIDNKVSIGDPLSNTTPQLQWTLPNTAKEPILRITPLCEQEKSESSDSPNIKKEAIIVTHFDDNKNLLLPVEEDLQGQGFDRLVTANFNNPDFQRLVSNRLLDKNSDSQQSSRRDKLIEKLGSIEQVDDESFAKRLFISKKMNF